MKLVWSPETASKAYIDTVKSCQLSKQSGEAEFIAAMAGGWNAKLIVEAWSSGGATTSAGLLVAAHHSCGRHVCIVPDERSRLEYNEAMHEVNIGMASPEVVVGEAAEVMEGLVGVDFMVVDCRRKDFARVLRFAKLSDRGAVLVCKNVSQRNISGFRWHGALGSETRIVRSVILPVGKGLDIAHVATNGGSANYKKGPSRWIKHIDQQSGEEYMFRR